jgi:hypothetical protein
MSYTKIREKITLIDLMMKFFKNQIFYKRNQNKNPKLKENRSNLKPKQN